MFGKKQREIDSLERELCYQRDLVKDLREELSIYEKNPLPEGCQRGDWCNFCVHGKKIINSGALLSITICAKNACKNFEHK